MLVSIRHVDVPELGARLGRHLFRSPYVVCKIVRFQGVLADDRVISPSGIPTSLPGWPMVTVVLDGEGLVRGGRRGDSASVRDLVCTPPGLEYQARACDPSGTKALLVQWDPAVLGPAPAAAGRSRLHARDFDRLRAAAREAVEAGYDGRRAAHAVSHLCGVLRAVGLIDAHPSADDLTTRPNASLERAGRAVDVLLSKPVAAPSIVDLQSSLGRSAAQTHRIVAAYAEALRSQGATGWREILHAWRIYMGMSLMTAERATTERVARVLGYRSPVAFCHAFANAGLPSPGTLRDAMRTAT